MKDSPIILSAIGTASSAAGFWIWIQNLTSLFALVAAFCGAVGGVWTLTQAYKRHQKRKENNEPR